MQADVPAIEHGVHDVLLGNTNAIIGAVDQSWLCSCPPSAITLWQQTMLGRVHFLSL